MATRILIVEDEAIVAMNLEMTLQRLGYETDHVPSGERAIYRAGQRKPDVALLDIMLAGELDGIGVGERFKTMDIPHVFLTAYADGETLNRAKLTDPLGYLVKPFREEELRTTVELALHRHGIERRLREQDRFFNVLLESLPEPVVLSTSDHRLEFANGIARGLLKKQDGDLEGTALAELFGHLDSSQRGAVQRAIDEACAEFHEVDLEWHSILSKGTNGSRGNNGNGRVTDYIMSRVVPVQTAAGSAPRTMILWRKLSDTAPVNEVEVPIAGPQPAEPPVVRPSLVDPASGLPTRPAAEKEIRAAAGSGALALVMVLDSLPRVQRRFGPEAAEELVQYYSVHMAQGLSARDRLFRWTGPAFVALLQGPQTLAQARQEAAEIGSVRLEKVVQANSRVALVVLTAAWEVIEIGECPEACLARIDGYIRSRISS